LVTAQRGRFEGDIECRPHRLRFSLDGLPTDTPPGIELPRLDSRILGGLIFARTPDVLGDDIAAPSFESEPPPSGLMALELPHEATVAADWKIVVELWLHYAPRDVAVVAGAPALAWQGGIVGDFGWSARRYRRLLDGAPPELPLPGGRSTNHWIRQFVPPNQWFEARPDGISVAQVLPMAAGRCVVRRSDYSFLPPDDAARAAVYLAARLGPSARRSHVEFAESVQAGMTGFAYVAASGRPPTPAVAWFHAWLSARIPSLALDRPPNEP
jgi:phenylpropionate dioxygenase-like ring-hydroxylating dioxygenase large terminal subunit